MARLLLLEQEHDARLAQQAHQQRVVEHHAQGLDAGVGQRGAQVRRGRHRPLRQRHAERAAQQQQRAAGARLGQLARELPRGRATRLALDRVERLAGLAPQRSRRVVVVAHRAQRGQRVAAPRRPGVQRGGQAQGRGAVALGAGGGGRGRVIGRLGEVSAPARVPGRLGQAGGLLVGGRLRPLLRRGRKLAEHALGQLVSAHAGKRLRRRRQQPGGMRRAGRAVGARRGDQVGHRAAPPPSQLGAQPVPIERVDGQALVAQRARQLVQSPGAQQRVELDHGRRRRRCCRGHGGPDDSTAGRAPPFRQSAKSRRPGPPEAGSALTRRRRPACRVGVTLAAGPRGRQRFQRAMNWKRFSLLSSMR